MKIYVCHFETGHSFVSQKELCRLVSCPMRNNYYFIYQSLTKREKHECHYKYWIHSIRSTNERNREISNEHTWGLNAKRKHKIFQNIHGSMHGSNISTYSDGIRIHIHFCWCWAKSELGLILVNNVHNVHLYYCPTLNFRRRKNKLQTEIQTT